jgi:5-methylthioadenosine/S-adenosylhomocysteine deaminase
MSAAGVGVDAGRTVRVVRARHVLTFGPLGHVRDGAVAVDAGGRIAAVGPWSQLRDRFPAAQVVGDGRGILTPGLISCHGHFSEGLVTGIGETHTLWEWFVRIVGPIEPYLTREMAYVGALLKAGELALSGVTTVADMFCSAPGGSAPDGSARGVSAGGVSAAGVSRAGVPGAGGSARRAEPVTPGVVAALDEVGLRGDVSFGPSDIPAGWSVEMCLAEHDALRAAATASRRSRFRVGLATIPSSTDALIEATAGLVAETGRLHVHLHEVREEVTESRLRRGISSVRYAERVGLLDGQTVAAHCVWLDDDDVAVLHDRGVAVAHCPVSNMILASGVCPVPRLLREGITVGLGVDGPASNDSQNMVETLKIAALLQKVHHLQATAMTAPRVLEMATIGGARALGIDDEVGSLHEGKSADLVLFGERAPTLLNVHDPYQALVYCASARDVEHVWVAGEPVVTAGQLVGVDLAEVAPHARELATALARDAGLPSELAQDPSAAH